MGLWNQMMFVTLQRRYCSIAQWTNHFFWLKRYEMTALNQNLFFLNASSHDLKIPAFPNQQIIGPEIRRPSLNASFCNAYGLYGLGSGFPSSHASSVSVMPLANAAKMGSAIKPKCGVTHRLGMLRSKSSFGSGSTSNTSIAACPGLPFVSALAKSGIAIKDERDVFTKIESGRINAN